MTRKDVRLVLQSITTLVLLAGFLPDTAAEALRALDQEALAGAILGLWTVFLGLRNREDKAVAAAPAPAAEAE